MRTLKQQLEADKALIESLPKVERDLLARETSGIGKTPGIVFKGRKCSFCGARATTMVSDDNDFFDCCVKCEADWQRDPGFCGNDRRSPQ